MNRLKSAWYRVVELARRRVLEPVLRRLEPVLKSLFVRQAFSLLVGLAVGVFLHYLLFRLTLPIQPFIYVAF